MTGSYIVGRWVRGSEHYARQTLIDYFLTAQDHAFWLVGTRRMGKTSLLRQMELITQEPDSEWEPLFWDLQGCTTPEDLSTELHLALEDEAERFEEHGIDIDALEGKDAVVILRRLNRALSRSYKQLLLLVDEAEVLIEINEVNSSWLARLRKTMQEGHQRTVVASTQLLTRLTAQSLDWVTSPFLFGFTLTMLWPFDRESAIDLICQKQGNSKITAEQTVIEEILFYTNHHPFLIQYLCHRLYTAQVYEQGAGGGSAYLRPVEEADLMLDHVLDAFFQIDFQQILPLEQQILLTVSEFNTVTEEQLYAMVGLENRAYLHKTLQSLRELGHLKAKGDGWVLGNEFLRRWLLENRYVLLHEKKSQQVYQPEERLSEENVDSVSEELGISTNRTKAFVNTAIDSQDQFFSTIQRFFLEIRHAVEQDDGHKLLVSNLGKGQLMLRSEEECQIALKHWLRPMCQAMDIDINREPLSGRGFLDFKFSIGYDTKCIVEVKLFNSAKLLDGVGIQLPLYLLADRAKYGIYVPIFLESTNHEKLVKEMKDVAQERTRSHGTDIAIIEILADKPKSASKADLVESLDRYGLVVA
ncbi:MAG: AAA family ATPase [Chloroflexota bacterium]